MTTVSAQEKFITINGVKLHYLDWGTEGKMPLVCLHAHTMTAHLWDDFAESMSPHFHVFALDQRGHGDSEWSSAGYARDRFVEDLAAFVDELGLSTFVLAGSSMGGWNSILYTPDHQDRVDRVILVDIAPEASPEMQATMQDRPPTPMEFVSLESAMAWLRSGNPWISDARLRDDAAARLKQCDDGRWTWKADPALFNVRLPDMTEPSMVDRYWSAFEKITCPVMLVRGKESILVGDQTVERMKQVGKQFSAVDVSEAGHLVTVDKPHQFIEVTRPFLGLS